MSRTITIQPRVFFGDIKISQKEIMEKYKSLLATSTVENPNYTEASATINELKTIVDEKLTDASFIGADLFNNIEQRLYELGDYYINYTSKKPVLTIYDVDMPIAPTGFHWISRRLGNEIPDVASLVDSTSQEVYEYNDNEIPDSTIGLIE